MTALGIARRAARDPGVLHRELRGGRDLLDQPCAHRVQREVRCCEPSERAVCPSTERAPCRSEKAASWCEKLLRIVREMEGFVKRNHTTGLVWNPSVRPHRLLSLWRC